MMYQPSADIVHLVDICYLGAIHCCVLFSKDFAGVISVDSWATEAQTKFVWSWATGLLLNIILKKSV